MDDITQIVEAVREEDVVETQDQVEAMSHEVVSRVVMNMLAFD